MEEKKLRRRKEKAYEERNNEQLAQSCRSLGDLYNQQGRYEAACNEYQQSSTIYSKMGAGKQLEMAKSHRMIAEMFMLLSEFDKALKHINIFLKIVKKLGNKVEIQRAYATLGRNYLLQGQGVNDLASAMRPLKLAEKSFIQSLLVCKELSGQISKVELLDMQARLYLNIGVIHEHMADFEKSISYMEKAIKICKANDLYELLHLCYVSASLLYQYKKMDTSLALRFCNLALEVSERLPNRTKKECETLIIKAEIMIHEGDFHSAKQVLYKAYKLKSPEVNDRNNIERMLRVVVALCNTLDALVTTNSDDYASRKSLYEKMGDGCCLLLNYKTAICYYLKMLDCTESRCESPKELASVYVSLYQTYKDDKQYDKALEYLWKEYEMNKDEPVEAFNTLCNIGEVYELESKPFWTIQDVYQKAINEGKKANIARLERIGLIRLLKLQQKFSMFTLMENLKDESRKRGIELDGEDEDSDSEGVQSTEHNTPNIGDDICLEDLTDSDNESSEQKTTTLRPQRRRNLGITIKRNNKGETQLHQACISGNLELARRLIDQGHAVNVRDHAGWLPLHEACNHGYREIVELLLDNDASAAINDKGGTGSDGITPLYDACSNGCLEVIDLLLERGANATLKTDFGDTVLNALDKWRNSVEADEFEQVQYENVRSKIVEQLSKAGILKDSNTLPSFTRNGTLVERNSNENETSLESLRRLAFNIDSDYSDGELSGTSHQSGTNRRFSNNESNYKKRRSDSSHNDEIESPTSLSSQFNRKSPKILTNSMGHHVNTKEDYRNVMEGLKHPNRNLASSENPSIKRSGYLDPGDVADDWLIDDIKPDKKKRKLLTDRHLYGTDLNSRLARSSISKENLVSPSKTRDEFDDSQDAFQILLESKGIPGKSSKAKLPRSSSLTGSGRSGKQSSLLENGFCRFRSESPQSTEENIELEPDSTTNTFITIQHSPEKEAPSIVSTISFKIKVEDEMLLIPVEKKKLMEANIRWLAEETSRRYYNLVGLRPVLRLMTSDGFAFEENDVINVALEHNMIASKVLEWKISPLSQRYEEMCSQLGVDADINIKHVLEKSQSNCILLNDQALTPQITLPIFKALLHQSSLRVLDLSNNFIQDEGCQQLGKSLGTLKQLKTLNLQGNCITSGGVNHLSTSELSELEELCFSYNPLGDVSIRGLEKICNQATSLKKLHLSSCKITTFYEADLQFFNLIDFDISFNNLSASSLKTVIMKLNSCRMQNLNLNFSTADNQLGSKLLEFLQNGTCEKFRCMNLSGCHLTDLDITKISVHLSKAIGLEILHLSGNPKVTPAALQIILNNVPQVKQIYMEHCWEHADPAVWSEIDPGKFEHGPDLIVISTNKDDADTLENVWISSHGNQAKILAEGNLIKLYVNDCDVR